MYDEDDTNWSTGETCINQKNRTVYTDPTSGYINEPITISKAIKAIKNEAIDTTDDYIISGEGIRKVGDDGYLGDIVYQVKEEN